MNIHRIPSYNFNLKSVRTEFCEITKKYDTDKCAWREYTSPDPVRHSHPYSIIYNSFLEKHRQKKIRIAEVGVLEGGGLLSFKEYLSNSTVVGFDYYLRESLKNNVKNSGLEVQLDYLNITDENSIKTSFNKYDKFDFILEDTTHYKEDQVRFIKNAFSYLNDGGMMVIEDIFINQNEDFYNNELIDFINKECVFSCFITLNHINKNSYQWNNDKLLILIKKGDGFFSVREKISIITPCSRLVNIDKIKSSLNFSFIDKWLICYDNSKVGDNIKRFEDPKIIELNNNFLKSWFGDPQRNECIKYLKNIRYDGMVYFLDDDNMLTDDFYNILWLLNNKFFYTGNFDKRYSALVSGHDVIGVNQIDTAQYIVPLSMANFWREDVNNADGFFITDINSRNRDKHIYIDNNIFYYNYISKSGI